MPSPRSPRTLCQGGALCLLLISGTAAWTQEEKPTPADPLVLTAQGIADIALMEQGLAPAGSPPAVSLDFRPGRASQPGPASRDTAPGIDAETTAQQQWAAQNWLLAGLRDRDAADAPDAESADPHVRAPAGGSADFWLQLMGEETTTDHAGASTANEEASVEPEDLSPAQNPLGGFMTAWLSEDSTALAELADDTDRNLPGSPSLSDWNLAAVLAQPLGRERLPTGLAPIATDAGRFIERANPYLPDLPMRGAGGAAALGGILELDATAGPQVTDFTPAVLPPAPAPFTLPPLPGETATAAPTDTWQPPVKTDEKYFQNLNRF